MWTIPLPHRVPVSKSGYFVLNLNQYRNTHFQVLNKAKGNFKGVVSPLLKKLPKMEECRLTYTLFPANRQLCDVSNVCSIVDKFFSDALVENGVIPDDNYTVVREVHYQFGSVDPKNPRVEVLIEMLKEAQTMPEKEKPMQIILVQSEVEQAIRDYVASRLTLADGTQIKIDLSATRGADGIKATIDLEEPGTVAAPASAPAPTQTAKKAPAAAEQPAPVATPQEPAKGTPEVDPAPKDEPKEPPFEQDPPADAKPEAEATGESANAEAPRSLFANLKKPQNS